MKKGFTLIELLAVVLIIGIMTSIALPQYTRSVRRAEAMEGLTNLKALFDSARRARAQNSHSPTSIAMLDIDFFDAQSTGVPGQYTAGNYIYTLSQSGVSAKKISGESDSYTFKIFYDKNGQKDVMTCTGTGEYNWVCQSFGEKQADGTYLVE